MNVDMNCTEPSPMRQLAPPTCSDVHLIGVAERVVRRVDDHLRVVVGVGPAVDADETTAAVVLRRPRKKIEPRRRHRSGTTPTHVLLLRKEVCSPRKIVVERPSEIRLNGILALRKNGPSIRRRSVAGIGSGTS